MKPPADWITMPRVFAVLMFAGVSFSAFIVPNPLHGAVVLYEDNAELGTQRVEDSMLEWSKAVAFVEGISSAQQ